MENNHDVDKKKVKLLLQAFEVFLDRYEKIEEDLKKSIYANTDEEIAYGLDILKISSDEWVQKDLKMFWGTQELPDHTEFLKILIFQKHCDSLIKQLDELRSMLTRNSLNPPTTGDIIRKTILLVNNIRHDFSAVLEIENDGNSLFCEPPNNPLIRTKKIEVICLSIRQLNLHKLAGLDQDYQALTLNETEKEIIRALSSKNILTGEQIAKEIGHPYDSNLKHHLAVLKRRKILNNSKKAPKGYFIESAHQGLADYLFSES